MEQRKIGFMIKIKLHLSKKIQIISFLCIYNHSNNHPKLLLENAEISTETFLRIGF